MVTWGLLGPDQRGNPITSIAACCARVVSGHTAALPMSVVIILAATQAATPR